jgi:hypothetical protein
LLNDSFADIGIIEFLKSIVCIDYMLPYKYFIH